MTDITRSSARQNTVSIIVPTFNASKTILRCLESIEQQSFKDFEVIVQDGNSTDGTLEIVNTFAERKPSMAIRRFQEADRGVYDAMNKAIVRCSGEWLLFLGGDDALRDKDVLMRAMKDPQTAACDLLYGNVMIMGDTSWASDGTIYDGPFTTLKLITTNLCHQAVFYRSSLVSRVGFYNTKYRLSADWDFNMRCWSQAKTGYIDLVVANFYSGGISTRITIDHDFEVDYKANLRRYGLVRSLSPRARIRYFADSQIGRIVYWSGRAKKLLRGANGKNQANARGN